jgi:hypothetical protein
VFGLRSFGQLECTLLFGGKKMLVTRFSIALAAVSLALLLSSPPAAADDAATIVKGTVVLKGVPLGKGTIFFHIDSDSFIGTKIKDGRFELSYIPVGSWQITVEGEGVPAKYRTANTTPMRAEFRRNRANILEVLVD